MARIGLKCKGARGPFPDVLGIKRFAEFVSDFIDGSGIARPLYLIAISGSKGSVACRGIRIATSSKFVGTASDRHGLAGCRGYLSGDGRGKSAKIEIIDAARGEAAGIAEKSPRGSAALSRLIIQKLMIDTG